MGDAAKTKYFKQSEERREYQIHTHRGRERRKRKEAKKRKEKGMKMEGNGEKKKRKKGGKAHTLWLGEDSRKAARVKLSQEFLSFIVRR